MRLGCAEVGLRKTNAVVASGMPQFFSQSCVQIRRKLRYSNCSISEALESDSLLHLVSHYLFYDPVTDGSPKPSSPSSTSQGKNKTLITVVAIVVPFLASIVLLYIVWVFVRERMNRRRHTQSESEVNNAIELAESIQCAFETIEAATDNFSDENKLGQGGFGHVYKGRLSNGQDIAVKRLSTNSGQGHIEFKNEVLLMAQLQHGNLVRLVGFCLTQNERLLIYEFLPNRSLDYFIFDPSKRSQLDWETRFKIIEGIARGLLYLHEESQQRIIHRDLKPSNILLDLEMNPKISDFGMARLFASDHTQVNTNRIVGTRGYMAPEYARYGQFSVKSDVFSYGVLILEIISGQKNCSFRCKENVEHLLSFAWKSWMRDTAFDIVDSTLKDGSRNEIMRCIHIGLLCVQEKASCRPTMASIVLMLNSNSFCLPFPMQPAFFINHRSFPSDVQHVEYGFRSTSSEKQGSKYDETLSANEVSITDLYPR
ncbi:cysteine-rich receptor-like protein kinase 44 [Prosopis cineraria]|uniref:cysteine-rich receptor-like protein kinase 44 n=1 Tax=Prosopis cineraria TaxID=364024 RepID=UPI00240ED4B3|nr:cysteine-rich receptor-like protein kinase 44 [Prosopis cineraria]